MNEEHKFPAWAQGPGWDATRSWLWRHKVLAVIIGIILGLVLSYIPKAIANAEVGEPLVDDTNPMATDPMLPVWDSKLCLPDGDPDIASCLWSTPVEVQKAKAGFFSKNSGFKPSATFEHPALARTAFADKIETRITAKNRDNLYAKYDPVPHVCQTDNCLAFKMYDAIASDASCAANGPPTNLAHTCLGDSDSIITQKGVVNGISLAVCGAGVVIAVITAGKAARLVAGGMGGACLWDAWKDWVFGP